MRAATHHNTVLRSAGIIHQYYVTGTTGVAASTENRRSGAE